jgi:hypothetical protein
MISLSVLYCKIHRRIIHRSYGITLSPPCPGKYFPFLLIEIFSSITKPKDQGMKPRSKGPLSRHYITQSISPRLIANRRVGLRVAELAPLLCSIVIINTTFWHLFYKIWYTFSECILEIKDLALTKDYNPESSLILFTAIATVDK